MNEILMTTAITCCLAGCVDVAPTTSTAEQGMFCDPFCAPDDTRYMMQAQTALGEWMAGNCQSCSWSCGAVQYPDGTRSAICDAIDGDNWLVGQCWVDYRQTGPVGRGCAAIPAE